MLSQIFPFSHPALLADILDWPTQSKNILWEMGLFLVALVLAYLLLQWRYRRRLQEAVIFGKLQAYGRRKGLNPAELKILTDFAESLSSAQRDEILLERRKFHDYFYDYLRRHTETGLRNDVRLLDKLFPQLDEHLSVKGLNDIIQGEPCAVEPLGGKGAAVMGSIVRLREENILISVKQPPYQERDLPIPARLYIYRRVTGSYFLYGDIVQVATRGLAFRFKNQVEPLYDRHIMCVRQLPVEISPWPPPGPQDEAKAPGEKPATEPSRKTPPPPGPETPSQPEEIFQLDDLLEFKDQKPVARAGDRRGKEKNKNHKSEEETPGKSEPRGRPEPFGGMTERVSDRAVLLRPDNNLQLVFLKLQEIWEIRFQLPDGYLVICRGRILRSAQFSGLLIFKFIDTSEEDRRELLHFILNNEGVREQIG